MVGKNVGPGWRDDKRTPSSCEDAVGQNAVEDYRGGKGLTIYMERPFPIRNL